jgi:hypothetical protein
MDFDIADLLKAQDFGEKLDRTIHIRDGRADRVDRFRQLR